MTIVQTEKSFGFVLKTQKLPSLEALIREAAQLGTTYGCTG